MATIFISLMVIVYVVLCFLLIGFILLQSGKGGGLSGLATGSSLNESLGAVGSHKTLSKLTAYGTVAFFLLTLLITFISAQTQKKSSSLLENIPVSATAPAQPQAAPATEGAAKSAEPVKVEGAAQAQPAEQKSEAAQPAADQKPADEKAPEPKPADEKPAEPKSN